MSIKKWLENHAKPKKVEPVHVDDLMILERWDEAEKLLKERLRRNSRDVQARLKMAELRERTGHPKEAVAEYVQVADRYAADGYFDKSVAMLMKAGKLAPMESTLQLKLQRVQRMRKFEQRLSSVMRSLSSLEGQVGATATTSYLELRRVWGELAVSDLMFQLDNEQLGRLLKVMILVKLGRRKLIVEKGDHRDELFLLTRGKVDVEIELPNGETTVIRSLEPGDVFGEQALLERRVWVATYRTAEPAVILRLDRPGLESALQGNTNPRGLLDALRDQGMDAQVIDAVRKTLDT